MTIFNPFNRGTDCKKHSSVSANQAGQLLGNPDGPSQAAVIYKSELDYMSRCILDYPKLETGGQLFGYWTSTGTPVVLYAIGPGKNAKHNYTSFFQDMNYLQFVGNELYRKYRLLHIGEWHSHHQLGLAIPSGGDVDTMRYGVGKPGFSRMLLCIGNCTDTQTTINPFNFYEKNPREYSRAMWDVVERESPFRRNVDNDLSHILIHPRMQKASHGMINTIAYAGMNAEVATHWLTESIENVEIMKSFVSVVQSILPDVQVNTEILDTGEPLIVMKEIGVTIELPYGFPSQGPILTFEKDGKSIVCDGVWEMGENALIVSFKAWFETLMLSLSKASQLDLPNEIRLKLEQDGTATSIEANSLEN